MKRKRIYIFIIIILLIFNFPFIKVQSEENKNKSSSIQYIWTWTSGSNARNQKGIYFEDKANALKCTPGARCNSISWVDNFGNLYLFGGNGFDTNGNDGVLNDLWKFDGKNWKWISGNNIIKQKGIYGKKGVPDKKNIPGARQNSTSWIDTSGNLYLFGGGGFDSLGKFGSLNDLWKFDGKNWIWISGNNIVNQKGIYGIKGTVGKKNIPGARESSISWIDSSNNLWLFGGYGIDVNGKKRDLNDLWKFDGKNWIWISGSNIVDQKGIYGNLEIPDEINIPGARSDSVCWIDSKGNFYFFGGYGFDNNNNRGSLNDLWKFDGKNWIWISGSNTINQIGNYGIKGVSALSNMPGGRNNSICWIDTNSNLWLFGGHGYDILNKNGPLNDLWKFDGKNWTWISGSDKIKDDGIYGVIGIANILNFPRARFQSISWIDKEGNFWLFGGSAKDNDGQFGVFNDLWKCEIVK